ncbi:DNA polymerase beta superfamily protein [Streptoalloteichus tenebrarius]|uniref:DNA polymerase beta superfamily protein n=1 Tax=Streptoalloteichus tenebrarius (strain ATCC 17920 / DSM 40477 / JCM 4838 / CBS 697.72 / NBRC 16177 / NCIMB 11028 / NRRL B-12390 / A12253. 1 / ISP 5477) TaxID=1933 RepID=UPI0020A57E44|nr:nucleotidyltransferase domain-containing protein [Streptoalloteichus tenebrarius]
MRLALHGNPTVILPLFVPESEVVLATRLGRELRATPELVLSRRTARRFLGYLDAQRPACWGRRGVRGRSWSNATASTRSSRTTWFASASRAWSCWRRAGSPCPSPSRGASGSAGCARAS